MCKHQADHILLFEPHELNINQKYVLCCYWGKRKLSTKLRMMLPQ